MQTGENRPKSRFRPRNPVPEPGHLDRPPRTRGGVVGGGGDALSGVERNRWLRRDPRVLNADEIPEPSPAPIAAARQRLTDAYERDQALAEVLALEWSVRGARVLIAQFGFELVHRAYEAASEFRSSGDIKNLYNPGGWFVTFCRNFVRTTIREGRDPHPDDPSRLT